MTDQEAYILGVLGLWQDADLIPDGLTWRVKDGAVSFGANCSDVFYWGTADVEDITPEDLGLLDECLTDLMAVDAPYLLPELFCARRRGMRPQTPFGRKYDRHTQQYPEDTMSPKVRALFDAAGPVRDRKDEG